MKLNPIPLTHSQTQTPYPQYAQHSPLPQSQTSYSQPSPIPQTQSLYPQSFQQPPQQQYPSQGPNLGILHRDVDTLIRSHRSDLVTRPFDVAIQERLSALLELQRILRAGQLMPNEVQQVRDQVDNLMASSSPAAAPPAPTPAPYNIPSYPPQQIPPQPAPVQAPISAAPDLSSLLSSNSLAEIIAKAQRGSATPPVAHASLAHDRPSSGLAISSNTFKSEPTVGSDLLASLRNAGIIPTPSTRTPTNGGGPFVAPPVASKRGPGPAIDVQLTSASLKM